MDQQWIEKLRSPRFTEKLRGYDREEVTDFLSELADWFEARGDGTARTGKGALEHDAVERVTENVGGVLRAAHEAAEKLRGDADQDARAVRGAADEHAERVRREADEHAERVRAEAEEEAQQARAEADRYARELRTEAERESERARTAAEQQWEEAGEAAAAEGESILEAARAEKAEVEASIAGLVERRDAVISDLQRLTGEIRSVVGGAGGEELGSAEREEPIEDYETREVEEEEEEEGERGDTAERPSPQAPFAEEDDGINPAL